MSILNFIVWPNKLLNVPSKNVEKFDTNIENISHNLIVTMNANNGIGLAAPQCGIHLKIIVVSCDNTGPITLINPEIISCSEEQFEVNEGCLSVPGYYENRQRPRCITVKYNNIHGILYIETFNDLLAFCIQHEIDHINGKTFVDNVSQLKKNVIQRKIIKTLKHK